MLADVFGRKKALCGTYVLLICGALTMALAGGLTGLVVGRVIAGLGIGAGFAVVSIYMAEVSPKSHRGSYVGLEDIFLVLGIALGQLTNYLLAGVHNDWRWMLGLGAVGPAVALVLLFHPQLPESPRWEMVKGNADEARIALRRLVGEEEAKQMLTEWTNGSVCGWLDIVWPTGSWRRRAVLASVGVSVLNITSGVAMLTVYIGTILARDVPERHGFLLASFIAFLRIGFTAVSILRLLDSVGRRPLLLTSTGGVTVALGSLAFLYWIDAPVLPSKLLAIILFHVFFSIGVGPASFVYSSEVLPTDMRSKGYGLAIFSGRIVAASINFAYPLAADAFGIHYVFLTLAAINTLGFFFVWFCVPETVGVALEEMQSIFERKDKCTSVP